MAIIVLVLMFTGIGAFTPERQEPSADEVRVREVMSSFLTAFNNLDWPAFRAVWSERPVIFFPSTDNGYSGERIDDPIRFNTVWQTLFDRIKTNATKGGATKPPYQNLQPRDLRIDFPSRDVAVVTFHLGAVGGNIGRRMFVLGRSGDIWKITHLHASNITMKPPGAD